MSLLLRNITVSVGKEGKQGRNLVANRQTNEPVVRANQRIGDVDAARLSILLSKSTPCLSGAKV